MATWFISDTHFGHDNIIRYCHRPFKNSEEMDVALIKNWNEKVGIYDHIYHLGDFSFKGVPSSYFHRLNGIKHLIKGNHDDDDVFKMPWASINDYKELVIKENDEKYKLVLFHYPIISWNGMHHNRKIHLFGHIHNNETIIPNNYKGINCCVEKWDYQPISLKQISERHERLCR